MKLKKKFEELGLTDECKVSVLYNFDYLKDWPIKDIKTSERWKGLLEKDILVPDDTRLTYLLVFEDEDGNEIPDKGFRTIRKDILGRFAK